MVRRELKSGRPSELPSCWRQWAEENERLAPEAAEAFRVCADVLAAALAAWATDPITLDEAAEFSKYSKSHLARLVSEGVIQNIGEPGRPRVRRCDLPVKPRKDGRPSGDLADRVLAGRG